MKEQMTLKDDIKEVLKDCMDYDTTSVDYDYYKDSIAKHMAYFINTNFKELEIPEA